MIRWQSLSQSSKILVGVSGLLLLFTIAYQYFYSGQWERYNDLHTLLIEKEKQLERARALAGAAGVTEEAYIQALESMTDLQGYFQADSHLGALIVQLGEVAQKNQVLVTLFSPFPSLDKGDYLETAVDIQAVGKFEALARFLQGVEDLAPSLVIRDLRIGDRVYILTELEIEEEEPISSPELKWLPSGKREPESRTLLVKFTLVLFQTQAAGQGRGSVDLKQWPVGRGDSFELLQEWVL